MHFFGIRLASALLSQIVRRLEVGLIFTWKTFEGFRVAFDPADIKWDVDSVELRRRSNQILRGVRPLFVVCPHVHSSALYGTFPVVDGETIILCAFCVLRLLAVAYTAPGVMIG